MTKNLHEPSNETELSRQGYRIRQLERRPASSGGDGGGGGGCLPYAIVSFFQDPGETIASDTLTSFIDLPDFQDSYESDSSVFQVSPTEGRIFLLTPGLFLAEASVKWDGDISGIKLVAVEWGSVQFLGEAVAAIAELSIDEDETTARSFVFATGEPANVTATFEQRSGSPQDVLAASVKVIRLAEYPAVADCSAGGAPVSWMTLDADTAVGSGGAATSILEDAENSFDSDPSILSADTANGTFDILEPGYYVAKFRGCWGSTATDYFAMISWEADVPGSSPCGSSFDLFEDASGTSWGVTGSDLIVAIGSPSLVRGSIHHLSGSSRTVTFASMSVTRVSPYDETPSS